MRVFYTPRYYADIGEGHIFPIRKFELVRNRLLNEGSLGPEDLVEPKPALIQDVLLVHTEDYVSRLCNGTLTSAELRRLGLPWSEVWLEDPSTRSVAPLVRRARHFRKELDPISRVAHTTLLRIAAKVFVFLTTLQSPFASSVTIA
jgi:acetoin utilization deacetylase AcuC-like enzyme